MDDTIPGLSSETMRKLARQQDYERYLSCLMAPAHAQPALFTMLSFQYELAKTAEAVSDISIGMIRLKWWGDVLNEARGDEKPRAHPVAEALAELPASTLSQLEPLIEARLEDIEYRRGFPTREQFDAYGKKTAGQLHWALITHLTDASEYQTLIMEAGRFYALVGLLRAMPYHLDQGIVRFPLDITKRYGISPAAVEQGLEKEAFAHFYDYWMQETRRQAGILHADVAALPNSLALIKRLHLLALMHAKSLLKADGDYSRLPLYLPNLPIKLWWRSKFSLPSLD